MGVGAGDVVAVQLPDTVEFAVSDLAIARLGAAMQIVHMPYQAAEIGQLLGHSRAAVFIGLDRFKNQVPTATPRAAVPACVRRWPWAPTRHPGPWPKR